MKDVIPTRFEILYPKVTGYLYRVYSRPPKYIVWNERLKAMVPCYFPEVISV